MLIPNPKGCYRFLKGIEPYSCGAVAEAGYEVVHATLRRPLPWREGFERVEAHLQEAGRARYALCGVELRCPAPYPMEGFVAFNAGYCEVLKAWGLYVDGLNPVARTNVAPVHDPPEAPAMHGFSYTAPCEGEGGDTLVVAGAGELRRGDLKVEGIVRRGEAGPDALAEKAAYVMAVMAGRLRGLGGSWEMVTMVDVYSAHPVEEVVGAVVLKGMGPARRHGVRRYHARPPVAEIEFEMDLRGVRREVYV